MRIQVSSMIIGLYGLLAVIVAAVVVLGMMSSRSNERLVKQIAELEAQQERTVAPVRTGPKTYRSARPALMRLQSALEERTRMLRDHQIQLKQQSTSQMELQQRFDSLLAEHSDLQQQHQLLLNEVDFYLTAMDLTLQDDDSSLGLEAGTADVNEDQPLAELDDETQAFATVEEFEAAFAESLLSAQPLEQGEGDGLQTSAIAAAATSALIDSGGNAVPALAALLSDHDPSVRAWAAWTLGNMGAAATASTSQLQELVDDEVDDVARAAADAIEKILVP